MCGVCRDDVSYDKHAVLRYPGCGHVAHADCYVGAVFIRRQASCWQCSPDAPIADDYGDCINMENLQLEEFTRRNLAAAASARRADYNITALLEQAKELVKLDEVGSDAARVVAVVNAVGDIPARPLTPWLPGATAEDMCLTRELLKVHTTPLELRMKGANVLGVINSRVTIDELLRWNYTLGELRDVGFTLDTLVTVGLRAAHLRQRAIVSVHVLRNVYGCTFEDVIQIERKFSTAYGALLCYLCVGLDLEGHRTLGLTNLHALRPHGLDRFALLVLAQSLKPPDLRALGLDLQLLRDLDALSADDVRALGGSPNLAVAVAALDISIDAVRQGAEPPTPKPPQLAITHTSPSPDPTPPPIQHHPPPVSNHAWRPPVHQRPHFTPQQPARRQPHAHPQPYAYQQPYPQYQAVAGPYSSREVDALLGIALQSE
jgi:hypothetical protein